MEEETIPESKVCSKCNLLLPINSFCHKKGSKYNLSPSCRECNSKTNKKWHEDHPNYSREWREERPDYAKERYKNDPDIRRKKKEESTFKFTSNLS